MMKLSSYPGHPSDSEVGQMNSLVIVTFTLFTCTGYVRISEKSRAFFSTVVARILTAIDHCTLGFARPRFSSTSWNGRRWR
jgi:hypothetical protein